MQHSFHDLLYILYQPLLVNFHVFKQTFWIEISRLKNDKPTVSYLFFYGIIKNQIIQQSNSRLLIGLAAV